MKKYGWRARARKAAIATALAATIVVGIGASTASASVPGKAFTQTQCEGDTDSVARLYTAGLGREAELGGFQFWVEEYVAGRWTLPQMAQFFVESPEFQASYGSLDDAGFINQLYLNVHKRPADQGGLDFWIGQMQQGMTRAIVLLRFSESPENIDNSGTVQPTLGQYNEGRDTGAFHCGPDLSPYFLTASDLPADSAPATSIRWSDEACYAALNTPNPHQGVAYDWSDAGLDHDLHHFPTPAGATAYMIGLDAAVDSCGVFADSFGDTVTFQSVNGPNYGDLTYGILVSGAGPNGTWTSYHLAVQVGNVVSIITISPGTGVYQGGAEIYGEVAAQRLIDAGF